MSLQRLFNRKHYRNRMRTRLHVESLERRQLMALVTADFADLALDPESFWHGPDPSGIERPGDFGTTERVGKFTSGGVDFQNVYNLDFGSWSSFAYSNVTDNTTPGFGNQHSAFAGSGRGDANYGVAFGSGEELARLPQFTLPDGATLTEAYVTNNTYAALSMLNGDDFAKKFGGASGDDPDFFKLTAFGTDAEGIVLPASAEIYLADYRFENNAEDYVADEWLQFDLSALAGAKTVYFNVTSSDVGPFGMNTPAYFVIDDITFDLPAPPNSAPVLDNTGSPALSPIDEDATDPPGTLAGALLAGAVTDPDAGALQGMAIVGADTANGTWQFTLDGGINWQPLGSPASNAARLLPADASTLVRFLPQPNFHGQATLTYHAWDQTTGIAGQTADLSAIDATGGNTAFSLASETALQTITPVNDAPVLDATPVVSLITLAEDEANSAGTLVQSLLAGAVTDADAATQQGMAIVAADTANGTWEFTLDGGMNWQPLGSPASNAARLLPADASTLVRFLPQPNFHGQASLTYHAWDQTTGTAGQTADLSAINATGGNTAFSLASEAAIQTITPVNDAPLLNTTPVVSLGTIVEDAADPVGKRVSAMVSGAISDIDANASRGIAVVAATHSTRGTWEYSLDDGTSWSAMGAVSTASALLLPATAQARVRFRPNLNFNGQVTLWYRAWDQTQAAVEERVDLSGAGTIGGITAFSAGAIERSELTIRPINDAPTISPADGGTLGYTRGAAAVRLLGTATVADPDSPTFGGGKLIVRFTGGHHAANRLAIGGGFAIEGNDIKLNGVLIGTRNEGGGEGFTRLEISFTQDATRAIVERLVRGIKFRTHGATSTVQRTIEFLLRDDQGAASNRAVVRVNVV